LRAEGDRKTLTAIAEIPLPDNQIPGLVMTDRIFNVLFLCTGNSARSILAEAILAREGHGRFRAFSAGSMPKPDVNPLAIETLRSLGYETDGLRSKSWDEFERAQAPTMDFIFTVCDNAAGEVCPIWPGHPQTAHWGIEDPAAVEGSALERKQAFAAAFRHLKNRITAFVALPFERLDRSALSAQLHEIGRQDGATPARDSQK
jgi:arsenate reductase (thioredoxin)